MADEPFAIPADLELRWRDLSDEEAGRASVLMADASSRLRRAFTARSLDLDGEITAGTYTADDARLAVVYMVKRAMLAVGNEGVKQASETEGPFSRSVTYANPMGNLYLTAFDLLDWFGLGGTGARTVWVH